MPYDIQVLDMMPGPLAVVRGNATHDNLSRRILELFNQVYTALAKSTVRQAGQNVVLYRNDPSKNLLATPSGCPLDVGVQVAAPFTDRDGLICSATPGGKVATVAYFGPYSEMSKAYDALFNWHRETGKVLAGPSWEVYGDDNADPAQLRTDIFFLLGDGLPAAS